MTTTWRAGIDVGGTFTDLVAVPEAGGEAIHLKVSSRGDDPAQGFLAAVAALRKRIGEAGDQLALILHGTTLATNAILEGHLARTALVTTAGFRDVLEIGRHWRTDLYDLELDRSPPIVPRPLRLEAVERMDADGSIAEPLTEQEIEAVIDRLRSHDADAVAIVFLHSYANPAHEALLARRMRDGGFSHPYVSVSSELSREAREFERTATTALNAALMPLIDGYLEGLERSLSGNGSAPRLYISQASGGVLSTGAARRSPVALVQSGPIAGVRACVDVATALGQPNAIAIDMGGTSTDVALIEGGGTRLVNELKVGELPVRLPAVQVHSVGAGGGSVAWLDNVGALRVGPRSAGASPGPACYGRGGAEPAVTDCHVVLGRLPADQPLGGFLELDIEAAHAAVESRVAGPAGLSTAAAAEGVLEVVNAAMEGAIRVILREAGADPRDLALLAYGGAGPLHAVEVAARLGIDTVLLPRHAGTLSAQGLLWSELRRDFAVSRSIRSDAPDGAALLAEAFAELDTMASRALAGDPDFGDGVRRERRCDVRYPGQAYEVGVPLSGSGEDRALERLVADFHARHERLYSFASPEEPCEIWTERLSVTADVASSGGAVSVVARSDRAEGTTTVVLDGEPVKCALVDGARTIPGDLPVPCVVMQDGSTAFVPPGVSARVADTGDLVVSDIPPR